jgi:TRAP-type mannitol/chloroaromatic compound transport system substrate-binding protein
VHRGVIDGCHAVPAFWHARNTAFSLFGSGPALGLDANGLLAWLRHGGGMALYLELIHRQMNLNIVPFFYGPMPTQPLGWFKKPVKSSAEIKGLKLPAEGLVADLFREMGAKADGVAIADIAMAMKRGQLDAAEFNNASSDRWLGLPNVAKVCMLQSYHQPAEVFEVLINRGKFDGLPPDLQAIVRHAAEAASADMSWKALHRYSEDQAWLRDKDGVQFEKTPAEVLRAQLRAWGAVVARHAQQNPLFDRVWRSQMAWARRIVGWSRATIVDPVPAYDFWFAGEAGKRLS